MRDGAVNRRSSDFFEKLAFEKESERRAVGGGEVTTCYYPIKTHPFHGQ